MPLGGETIQLVLSLLCLEHFLTQLTVNMTYIPVRLAMSTGSRYSLSLSIPSDTSEKGSLTFLEILLVKLNLSLQTTLFYVLSTTEIKAFVEIPDMEQFITH